MAIAERVRAVANDPSSPHSLGARSRARRWDVLVARFPELSTMHVLDLGGTAANWSNAPQRPEALVLLNVDDSAPVVSWATTIRGDACDPPPAVRASTFDLVYSNSVIEHVGGHYRRQRMAEVIHAAAPHHWIQTPYRYFPVEPHWLCPGFQFLPAPLRVAVARRWPLAWSRAAGAAGVDGVLDIELLSRTEMQHYFPGSTIVEERLVGLVKSLIAVR